MIKAALAGFLVGLAFSASSLTLNFSGQVKQYGFPVPNVTVSYDLNGTPNSSVLTDSLGFFSFNLIDSLNSGSVKISIFDCNSTPQNQTFNYDTNSTLFNNISFNYCSDSIIYVQGSMLERGIPSPGEFIEFSFDGFQNVHDSTQTSAFGTFGLPLNYSTSSVGLLSYRFTDCMQQLSYVDSIYFQLGDTLTLNIEACPSIDTTTVSGFMFSTNSYPVSNYQVQLIALDTAHSRMSLKDVSPTSAQGAFSFRNVPDDYYLLRCVPLSDMLNVDSIAPPSYFGGNRFWSNSPAVFLEAGKRLSPWVIEEIGPVFGPGQISGNVEVHQEVDLGLGRSPVYLLDASDSSLVSYAIQDGQGAYSFADVPEGDYLVYLDFPGLPTEPASVRVSAANADFNIDIYANPGGVSFGSFVGLDEQITNSRVYPNPAVDVIQLELPPNHGVEIHSQLGQVVYSRNQGTRDFQIDVHEWNSGIYRLSFIEDSGKHRSIKILKL